MKDWFEVTANRYAVSDAIRKKSKWVERLRPLARESAYANERGHEFEKVCRGYAIATYQKLGKAFNNDDLEWVCGDVHFYVMNLHKET